MSRTNRNHQAASGYGHYFIGSKCHGQDCKPWHCPPKWYKRMLARIRRAKDAQALREGREAERWRRTDRWNWT